MHLRLACVDEPVLGLRKVGNLIHGRDVWVRVDLGVAKIVSSLSLKSFDEPSNVVCSWTIRGIASEVALVGVLVDSDIINRHAGCVNFRVCSECLDVRSREERSQAFVVYRSEVGRDTQVHDEVHGLVRNRSISNE